MNKILKQVTTFLFFIPLFFSLSSCVDDPDDLNNSENQEQNKEEIRINYLLSLTLYEDEKYVYKFGLTSDEKDIEIYCKDKQKGGDFEVSPKVNGKYLCGMKMYSSNKLSISEFESLKTKYSDFTAPENLTKVYRPVHGAVFLVYLFNSKGEIINYKIYVNEISYDTKNSVPQRFKYLTVFYRKY